MNITLNSVSQSQQDRLAYVELMLRFLGEIKRQDILSRFGVQTAAASRDLALYKHLAPENLFYNGRRKVYECCEILKPIFSFTVDRVLTWISQGYGDGEPAHSTPRIYSELKTIDQPIDMDILSAVSRAIYLKKILDIESVTSECGKKTGTIVPFALANTGYGWSIRAYDRTSRQFDSFDLALINSAKFINGERRSEEGPENDILWSRQVELDIVPHPSKAKQSEAIEFGYNMKEGNLKIWVRAPLVGYMLRRWNIDSSEKHILKGPENLLWLRNRQTLYGVPNLSIAPGYEATKKINKLQ